MSKAGSSFSPARWGDLGRRVVSALVMAPLALFCFWLGGPVYDALMVAVGLGAVFEWLALFGMPFSGAIGAAVVATVAIATAATVIGWPLIGLIALGLGWGAVWVSTRMGLLSQGVVYVGMPLIALLWLRGQPGGRDSLVFLVLVIWASDVGAYMVGRLVGGPKLAPALSPGKTWSGAAGGLAAAALLALVWPVHRWELAILLALVGQVGDLLESGIKRHVGVKDSGHLIPGHGGLLDRLDGLMAAAPVAAIVMYLGRGGLG